MSVPLAQAKEAVERAYRAHAREWPRERNDDLRAQLDQLIRANYGGFVSIVEDLFGCSFPGHIGTDTQIAVMTPGQFREEFLKRIHGWLRFSAVDGKVDSAVLGEAVLNSWSANAKHYGNCAPTAHPPHVWEPDSTDSQWLLTIVADDDFRFGGPRDLSRSVLPAACVATLLHELGHLITKKLFVHALDSHVTDIGAARRERVMMLGSYQGNPVYHKLAEGTGILVELQGLAVAATRGMVDVADARVYRRKRRSDLLTSIHSPEGLGAYALGREEIRQAFRGGGTPDRRRALLATVWRNLDRLMRDPETPAREWGQYVESQVVANPQLAPESLRYHFKDAFRPYTAIGRPGNPHSLPSAISRSRRRERWI